MSCGPKVNPSELHFECSFQGYPTCLPFVTSRHICETRETRDTRDVTHMTHDTQVADRPNMCYIFENVMVQGP